MGVAYQQQHQQQEDIENKYIYIFVTWNQPTSSLFTHSDVRYSIKRGGLLVDGGGGVQ